MTTAFVGHNLFELKETPSTNGWLHEQMQRLRLPEGTAVTAAFQSEGRGQRGTTWQSSPGQNILLSVLLYPKFLGVADSFLLSQAIGLAVYDCVLYFVPKVHVSIKWPNDVIANGQKVAGILIENSLQGSTLQSSIIGIGLNVNEKDLPETAVSLSKLAGRDFPLRDVLEKLFSAIESRYVSLKSGGKENIHKSYLTNLHGLGIILKFTDNLRQESFFGIITGINAPGHLLVEREEGTYAYDVKEISFH